MKMVRIVAGFLLLPVIPAWGGKIDGTCDFRFLGTSTLHDFSGTVRCLPFTVDIVNGDSRARIIPEVEVEVPVRGMDTGNEDRDRQMHEMFESDRFPRIHGTVRNLDADGIRTFFAKEGRASISVSLRIRDVERMVPATVTGLREENGRIRFDVEFPVSLRDFGLKAPSVLFFIRVGDRVIVRGNFDLRVSSYPTGPR